MKKIRDFLFNTFNREFLIFLFFLVLSTAYWLMSVLNDTMERDVTVPLQLVGVPKNVVLVDDATSEVRVTVRDKGYALASYFFGDKIKTVKLPFSLYAKENDKCTISSQDLIKQLTAQVFGSTKVVATKPEKIIFHFNYGLHKSVPVKLAGTARPQDNLYLADVKFEPANVTIYASQHVLDSIRSVFTVRQNIRNFSDTLRRVIDLQKIRFVKMVPARVTMTLCPDIMTEAVITVPVTPVNVPVGKVLRCFPPQVEVHYAIGASQYSDIDESQFTVVADYATTENGTTDKCALRIQKTPRSARNVRITETQISYLIEQ